MKTARTTSIIEERNASGPVYIAQVREIRAGGRRMRTYLGRWPEERQARAACRAYLATGERPAPKKRGMKDGQRKRTPPQIAAGWTPPRLLTDRQAKPLPSAERLARMAAKGERQLATVTRSATVTGQHSPEPVKTPTRANFEPAQLTMGPTHKRQPSFARRHSAGAVLSMRSRADDLRADDSHHASRRDQALSLAFAVSGMTDCGATGTRSPTQTALENTWHGTC